ncbi:MAG: DNA polymerase III subunit delta [Kiritimatiellae bacterium]|nr:DNA polymerase III subunit delta [Kiritimatiellia bacterium]
MAKKSAKETQPELGTPKETSVWLIWGGDEFLVSRHARELTDRLCPPAEQALGLEVIDARAETKDPAVMALQRCRGALNTVGFFGASKTIWLRDADFFSDTKVGRLAAVKGEVAKLAEIIKGGLLDGQRLVISASKVDRRSAFYKACQANGEVIEFGVPEKSYEQEKYAAEIVNTLLRGAGLKATRGAIDDIVGKVGGQSRLIHQEVEKLRNYVGDRKEITEEDTRLIVSASREAAGWDLADALGERNIAKALDTLRQLLSQNEKAFVLIMGLQNRVRELTVFRACLDQRWLQLQGQAPWQKAIWHGAGDASHLFDSLPDTLQPERMNPWRAGRLAAQAGAYTRAELARAQQVLLDAHEAMLRSSAPHELLLELALVRIMGTQRYAA